MSTKKLGDALENSCGYSRRGKNKCAREGPYAESYPMKRPGGEFHLCGALIPRRFNSQADLYQSAICEEI
jgi:hypothetical protein